ncbi:uncharacterized protein BYT42DRAFT_569139 [Radiomyces spectabilis]|uniref:uncharacterized protein n=1 Tax=Radiomyces spectabilis TaxID=64574 RepID=UPI0022212A51|nr:uncharacterized protein BYT42DRAFT_569139 [Radiomyces spectabilis]KAI8379548.1 hypothetical protein BYT42DRAFT_569139 [Radiomyces spectabilis]
MYSGVSRYCSAVPYGIRVRWYAARAARAPSHLQTFLAQSTDKDQLSTTFRGKMFELQTLEALSDIGMELQHVGGRSDGGVDLRGIWPLERVKPNVIVQCKNTKMGCTPDHLRSLIGAMAEHRNNAIGVLATVHHRHFTRDVISLFTSSGTPLALARIENTQLESFVFNDAAEQLLQQLVITKRFDAYGNSKTVVMFPK